MADWTDTKRTDLLRVEMVSATDPEQSLGWLRGVDASGCSVDAGYYTDCRTSAKIRVVGEGWVRGSFLRIWHDVPEWGYHEPIGTYLVTNDAAERGEGGEWVYDLTCQGVLYALSTDLLAWPVTRAKGSSAKAGMRYILDQCKRRYIDQGANDTNLGSALVMETGKSMLSHLYGLCRASNNRLDVDPRGRVRIEPYVAPGAKTPVATIDLTDGRGVSQAGTLSRSTDWLSAPSRVAVSFKYTEQVKRGKKSKSVEREIDAVADVGALDHRGPAQRGYTITDYRSVSDMKPRTKARAQQLANSYLKEQNAELVEWSLKTTFLPIWEGDVVWLNVPDGMGDYRGKRKCLVKALTIDCDTWTMDLKLKETASGDKGETDHE